MCKVLAVNPYIPDSLGGSGIAKRMFICQNQFPLEYDGKDILEILHSHRINGFAKLCTRHGFNEANAEGFFRNNLPPKIMSFLRDLLDMTKKGMKEKTCSGYQVFADSHAGGRTEWTLQLFFKHPDSKTELHDELPELGKARIM